MYVNLVLDVGLGTGNVDIDPPELHGLEEGQFRSRHIVVSLDLKSPALQPADGAWLSGTP